MTDKNKVESILQHFQKGAIDLVYEKSVKPFLEGTAFRSSEGCEAKTFQARVQAWMMACFGPAISADIEERNHRFLEESLELVQASGCTASEAHQLVDYVFGRPAGELRQEIGGAMVTLAALCLAQNEDMHAAGETELARIWTKVEAIRAKQAAKPKHSPLPAAVLPVAAARSVDTCAEMRAMCSACGGTGDAHRADGEWLGEYKCMAALLGRVEKAEADLADAQRKEAMYSICMNTAGVDDLWRRANVAEARAVRLEALLAATGRLIKAKGRHHTELNYLALVAAYDVAAKGHAAGSAP